MSVRQTLQATLEARRSQQRCWRCALGSPRYSYASQQREAKHPQQADTDLLKPSTQPNLAQFSRHEYEVLPNQTTPISGVHRKTVSKNRTYSLDPLIRTYASSLIRTHGGKAVFRTAVFTPKDGELVPKQYLGSRGKDISLRPQPPILSKPRFRLIPSDKEPSSMKSNKGVRSFQDLRFLRQLIDEEIDLKKAGFQESSTDDIEYSVGGDDKLSQIRRHIQIIKQTQPSSETEVSIKEDETFHEGLESVLDTFTKLQIPSSADVTRSNSSNSIPDSQSHTFTDGQASHRRKDVASQHSWNTPRRWYSTAGLIRTNRNYSTAAAPPSHETADLHPPITQSDENLRSTLGGENIREHLRLWQEQHKIQGGSAGAVVSSLGSTLTASQNLYTQSGEDDGFVLISRDEETEDESDVELGSDDAALELLDNHLFFRRGDLVELKAGNEPILAIFVRNLIDQCQFYTMRGEWVNRGINKARFAVPGFVHPNELEDVLPYLPVEEVEESRMDKLQPIDVHAPRDAGAKVIEKMWLFHQAADNVFRRNADRINRAYEIIAPSNESEGRSHKSLRDIAMIVLQKDDPAELTHSMLWAVHRALMPSQNITFDHINDRLNPVYEIHPQQSLRDFARVQDWVREFQENLIEEATESFSIDSALMTSTRLRNPISTFVQKARAAIEQSRQTRPLSVNGAIGPSSVKFEPTEPAFKTFRTLPKQLFDDKEKVVIRYFDAWVASEYINQRTNLSALGPMILRATGKYDGFELKENIGFTLLQELGVVTPWENRTVYSVQSLRLPGHDTVSEETTRLRKKAQNWVLDVTGTLDGVVDEPIDSMHKFNDSMERLRKDWGDLPVFCIDEAQTLERDDGVSLQPVDGNPSEYWVHIHVANPSAFVTPDSPVGKYAAHLFESVYFPERRYPMLSPVLSSDRFSLANERPCLTFSARISTEGDILERKITSGMVRNVHYLTPQSAGLGMGLYESEKKGAVSLLTVGGELPLKPENHNPMTGGAVAESHIEILRTLLKLGEAARCKRVANGAPDFYSTARSAETYPQVLLSKDASAVKPFQISTNCVYQFEGDPIVGVETTTEWFDLVRKMVADLMILAGEVAATWCMERNIPIPYRGIQRNPEPPIDPEEFKKTVMDPKIAKYGYADQGDLLRYMKLMGKTTASASPLEHFALGLPAYCKATSPLRRYTDLYTHWQIEAALRHEAETGSSLVGSTNASYLPFPRTEVEEFARTALQREKKITHAKTLSSRHWIVQAFFRAFYFNQAPLPKTFMVSTMSALHGVHRGWLQTWSLKVILNDNDVVAREGGFQIGDLWETKIAAVEPYYSQIIMEPIRLVEREIQTNEMKEMSLS